MHTSLPNTDRPGTIEAVGGLQQRLHDGLCQHLAAGALLQTLVVERLEKLGASTFSEQDLRSLVENARRTQELIYEALEEVRALMQLLH